MQKVKLTLKSMERLICQISPDVKYLKQIKRPEDKEFGTLQKMRDQGFFNSCKFVFASDKQAKTAQQHLFPSE